MALHDNTTLLQCVETVGVDPSGRDFFLLVLKATYTWQPGGAAVLADVQQPIVETDIFDGDPSTSSPLREAELVPEKRRVDVLFTGALIMPRKISQAIVGFQVGAHPRKLLLVTGDRGWYQGLIGPVLTKPFPFNRMPITWARSFGGRDPKEPKTWEPRNPVGRGLRHKPAHLVADQIIAPNFELADSPIKRASHRPPPVGFGPVGRDWQPRVGLAGTFDDAWREERWPLLPKNFNPLYYNCAPPDQQLDTYPAGEVMGFKDMTAAGRDSVQLPSWSVCVDIFDRAGCNVGSYAPIPDTIIINPETRCLELVGRVKQDLGDDPYHIGRVTVREREHSSVRVPVLLRGTNVCLHGTQSVTLRCGDAEISLSKAGDLLTRARNILSRALGMHRIKGAAIRLN